MRREVPSRARVRARCISPCVRGPVERNETMDVQGGHGDVVADRDAIFLVTRDAVTTVKASVSPSFLLPGRLQRSAFHCSRRGSSAAAESQPDLRVGDFDQLPGNRPGSSAEAGSLAGFLVPVAPFAAVDRDISRRLKSEPDLRSENALAVIAENLLHRHRYFIPKNDAFIRPSAKHEHQESFPCQGVDKRHKMAVILP